jgi:hypothetical protein
MHTQAWLAFIVVAAVASSAAARADRIQNRWKPDQFLHVENGKIEAGPVRPDWLSAQWSIEGVRPGTPAIRIRNRWKPDHVLHVESGTLEAGPAPADWLSAMWTLEQAGSNYVRIRNIWKNNLYIHIEQGQTEAGEVKPDWLSAQWLISADGASIPTAAGQAGQVRNLRVRTEETCGPAARPDGTFDFSSISAICPAPKHVTGGGCSSSDKLVTIFSSQPAPFQEGWSCLLRCNGSKAKVSVVAICGD